MTRTITLAKGSQRYVFRCSGDRAAPLVDKLIRLARSRPDVARNVHLRTARIVESPDAGDDSDRLAAAG